MLAKPDTCIGCPLYCKPYGKTTGFSTPDGTGANGVFICAEALGEQEEKEGKGLIGQSGYTLFQQLKRINIERDDFTIFNTIACRPPDNKLVKQPYEAEAVAHCAPNLDRAIEDAKVVAQAYGKTFTIVTLGITAFKRVMGYDYKRNATLLKKDFYGYPFWNQTYGAWVFNVPHPAYLLRGNTHLWPVVHFTFQRALEVATNGFRYDIEDYLLDPDAEEFEQWIKGYERSLIADPDNPLSYDIETPYKKKSKDEEEVGKEEAALDEDHTILRCSFSYWANDKTNTTSVVWDANHMDGIERLFTIAKFVLGWNSDKYDYPRVSRYLKVAGIGLDAMVAWHILNTSLPKALGFVTPYYWQNTAMWKHMADDQPAFYNAKDADAALRCWIGIKRDLIQNKLWKVYEEHWIELSKPLKYMSNTGVLRDEVARANAEKEMSDLLVEIEGHMEESVPLEAREIKIYKKAPKVIEAGMFEIDKEFPAEYCAVCGILQPNKWKKHKELCISRKLGEIDIPYCCVCWVREPKKWAKHKSLCAGKEILLKEPDERAETVSIMEIKKVWGKPLEFKISKKRMTAYQQSLKHQAIIDRKEKKVTFNADALEKLMKQYPTDKLYPTILKHRKVQKLLSTYVGYANEKGHIIGGMPIGPDGRIHTVYGRDASTLRFTSEDPNLQNLPRPNPKDPTDLVNRIRNLVTAQRGSILYARDYSGIEAVLTGYFSLDPRYIRLAKHDVHTYYTVYALHELEGGARIKTADLPELDWPDDRLFPYLAQLKKEFKKERDTLYKHLVHAANFMQGAMGARDKIFSETGIEYPVKTVQRVMDVYYALFPKIKDWHRNVLQQVEKDGYIRNPFDYVHRFNRPYDYKKEYGVWTKKPGADANKIIAFGPQSTAVGIISDAIMRLYFERFEAAGQYLRLQVHDELLFEIPLKQWENVDTIVREEMERPVPQLRLPESWGMGSQLSILTEAKADFSEPSRWGQMKGM